MGTQISGGNSNPPTKPPGAIQEVTIADAATTPASGYWTKGRRDLVRISVDANFDGTSLSFEVSTDGTNWEQHAWGGNDPHTETISESCEIDPAVFAGCVYIRPVSDAAQSGADCVVTAVFRQFSQ